MFLIIKSDFLFTLSSQPSILTVITIMCDDYLRQIMGSKICPNRENVDWPNGFSAGIGRENIPHRVRKGETRIG